MAGGRAESHGRKNVVLLDIMLPGVDGITLARELRAKNPNIGIIMLPAKMMR